VPDACTYATPFLAWWGLSLYLLQLRCRRQRDYDLRDGGAAVLANLNRLAQTEQRTVPVHDTLDHFLGHVALCGWEELRTRAVQRLLRMKVLDAAREFIDNADAGASRGQSAEEVKHDCALKALHRLLPRIQKD
jgi:hypothetical protein